MPQSTDVQQTFLRTGGLGHLRPADGQCGLEERRSAGSFAQPAARELQAEECRAWGSERNRLTAPTLIMSESPRGLFGVGRGSEVKQDVMKLVVKMNIYPPFVFV